MEGMDKTQEERFEVCTLNELSGYFQSDMLTGFVIAI